MQWTQLRVQRYCCLGMERRIGTKKVWTRQPLFCDTQHLPHLPCLSNVWSWQPFLVPACYNGQCNFHNQTGRLQGQLNPPLNATGLQQAAVVSKALCCLHEHIQSTKSPPMHAESCFRAQGLSWVNACLQLCVACLLLASSWPGTTASRTPPPSMPFIHQTC